MKTLRDLINIDNFKIQDLRIDDIMKVEEKLPKSGVFDLNIAEGGLILTLEGQNLCQDKIAKIDRYLGYLETEKNKAWSIAALEEAKEKGYKTAKDKEWYAQSNDAYIEILNQITVAKVSKKWLENKASYFSGWHYSFKTFIRRDYSIENISGVNFSAYNIEVGGQETPQDFTNDNEIEWG
jgi:hypothetical protein